METTEEISFLTILLPLAGIIFLIALGVLFLYQQFQKNIIRQQLEREEMKSKYQKNLLSNTIRVQEEERKRIARDLHDELGAALSIGRMQLTQLEKQAHIEPQKIVEIRELIETTLASTRRISHELMPLQLAKLGLEKALLSLLSKAKEAGQLETNIAIGANYNKLPWLIEVGIYRIYSELVNNTLKHSEATRIDISILHKSDQLFCRYADNGKGLPKEIINQGLGLKSLENRVKAFEGELEFGNRNEGGFFTRFKIPLNSFFDTTDNPTEFNTN